MNKIKTVTMGAVVALSMTLASCGGVKESVRDDYCQRFGAASVDGRKCKCLVKAVTDAIGGKAEHFMLNAIGDLSREERDNVKKTMDTITMGQTEKIGEDSQECMTGDD
jgi:hypothetical protein